MKTLEGDQRFVEVQRALSRGESATIDGAWGSACALSLAALVGNRPSAMVIVVPRVGDVESLAADVATFSGARPLVFPAWETLPEEQDTADPVFAGRLRSLSALQRSTSPVLVASIAALMQPVPSREDRNAARRRFATGEELDPEELLQWLVSRGLVHTTAVALPGEFSRHGGIIDVFAPDARDPVRLEFFGDEIESIRSFDAETQRQRELLTEVELCLVEPTEVTGRGELLSQSLPDGTWVALVELPELKQEGEDYRQRLGQPDELATVETVLAGLIEFPSVTVAALAAASMETTCHLGVESIERFVGPRTRVLEELQETLGSDDRVLVACHNEAERGRLVEMLDELPQSSTEGIGRLVDKAGLCVGRLDRGFRLVGSRLVVLGDNELFNRTEIRPQTRGRSDARAIDSFLDLEPGNLVVHLTHGIGRYRGLKLLSKDERSEEHLVLEFRDQVQLFVPVSLIHLVQKYIGPSKTSPELSRVGTASWSRKKDKVAQAVGDLASDMLRLQAAREAQPGLTHPVDSHWQQEFEQAFPYVETPDQVDSIADVSQDMQRSRPMDRLICGDVGYGKTEVAMRAAFKAIDGGRQVAVLVPTTVLAEQHYRTFSERMAEFPVSIESLSRFKTKRQQRETLERLSDGTVDVVIGTHRLVQKDVAFADLGLLVIDEEQRFGVAAKELLKRLRLEVDVLTMTATPIPRTLHMSLLGIRDISNLQTPPRDRLAIVTRIARDDDELIRQAIVRELNRNGQVFFVHNRVHNIHIEAQRLQRIIPEARLGVVHGQMKEQDLEQAMLEFVQGRIDVLVATTIIESGLDIPNANTIFIHEADRYGLADLHQLRGRVGRYRKRAYCYLLLPETRPLSQVATRRLKAVEEYSELGAGFKIAMRDLEIRGAGNILGTQQSGHIATVGYELYCRLVENAVRRLQDLPPREDRHVSVDLPLTAYLPNDYVPPGRHKVDVYRRLTQVVDEQQLQSVREELRDRFGPLPEEVERLLEVRQVALQADAWGIEAIRLEPRRDGQGPFVVMDYRDAGRIRRLASQSSRTLRVVDGQQACLVLEPDETRGDLLLGLVKSVLRLS
ncbi:MAG: transcription-repair coupling factor [Planctomycetaceae bacterium]|nr:transcription-repair coupling factor [Planctomycetaceae bacterium]